MRSNLRIPIITVFMKCYLQEITPVLGANLGQIWANFDFAPETN